MTGRRRAGWAIAVIVVLGAMLGLSWWLEPHDATPAPARGASAEPTRRASPVPSPTEARPELLQVAAAPVEAPFEASAEDMVVIHGIVQDPDGGAIEGASLVLQPDADGDGSPLVATLSDAAGRFRFELPELEQSVLLVVEADGHTSRSYGPGTNWSGDELEIRLYWLTALFGRVLDGATGNPLGGARLSGWDETTTSDVNGNYRMLRAPVGLDAGVRVELEGYVRENVSFMIRKRGGTELDVSLRRGQQLVIEVVDRETGQPLGGAEVRHWSRGPVVDTTDALGRFELTVGEGYELSVHVSADGSIPVGWGVTLTEPVLTSARLSVATAAWFEGRLTNSDGEPLAGVGIYASGEDEQGHDHGLPGYVRDDSDQIPEIDEQGHYRLPVLPSPAELELAVYSQDYVRQVLGPFVLDTPGAVQRLDVTLEKGATIRGTARHNDEPWEWASITWTDGAGDWGGRAEVDDTGAYELAHVQAGDVLLSATAPSGESPLDAVTLVVEADETYVQDFHWREELATISGRVTDVDPRRRWRVSLAPRRDGRGRSLRRRRRSRTAARRERRPRRPARLARRRPGRCRGRRPHPAHRGQAAAAARRRGHAAAAAGTGPMAAPHRLETPRWSGLQTHPGAGGHRRPARARVPDGRL